MCGIFGVVSLEPASPQTFIKLAELNKARGNLGFGGLWGDPEELRAFRYPQPFELSLAPAEPARVQLGHIRAPTGRQTTAVTDIHPFVAPCGWLAHNGLLLNHAQFPEWQLDTAVDSAIILGGIQLHLNGGLPLPAAVRQTVEKLDGQQACWLWSKTEKALYFWRVMSPIYVGHHKGQFIFSSVTNEWAADLLPEGVIFCLTSTNLVWTESETFSFYSPYQINQNQR